MLAYQPLTESDFVCRKETIHEKCSNASADRVIEDTPKDSGTRFSEFAGQQHPDLQTDEDMRQRQSHNLPDDDDQL